MENTMKKMLEKLWQMCKERIDSLIMKLVEDGKSSNLESDYILLFDSHKIPNRVGHDHMTYFDFREFLKWLRKMFDNYYTKTAVDAKLKNLKEYVDENMCKCGSDDDGYIRFKDNLYVDGQELLVKIKRDNATKILIESSSSIDVSCNEASIVDNGETIGTFSSSFTINSENSVRGEGEDVRSIEIVGFNNIAMGGNAYTIKIKNRQGNEITLKLICEDVVNRLEEVEDRRKFTDDTDAEVDITDGITRDMFGKTYVTYFVEHNSYTLEDELIPDNSYDNIIDIQSDDISVISVEFIQLPTIVSNEYGVGGIEIKCKINGEGDANIIIRCECGSSLVIPFATTTKERIFTWSDGVSTSKILSLGEIDSTIDGYGILTVTKSE